jgi:hypothetical protein
MPFSVDLLTLSVRGGDFVMKLVCKDGNIRVVYNFFMRWVNAHHRQAI